MVSYVPPVREEKISRYNVQICVTPPMIMGVWSMVMLFKVVKRWTKGVWSMVNTNAFQGC